MEDRWFNVGKIVNTHGIRGEVRVISKTDFPNERYRVGNTLFLFFAEGKEPLEVTVDSHRRHKSFDLLTFKGFENINDVEKFKGCMIKIPEHFLGELDEDEFYFHEIIGCKAFTADGEEIGTIREILTPGANDVWVIKRRGKKDALIPFVNDFVKTIDVKNKQVVIEPMEGLLDE
ncbi:ribosome maturation factor RimM [Metabacillus arenae]|uniref:Ribosome maturation factor RimM n=1 Tax=Metabacillus arenae TaxID=2771434 RepID=A0A926NGE0_9BACI|nr:ribosome maturation factor RimM [Metabacillus arenae]MBD1380023.1 ribosome maturation factor RimM [Metabacillus arenae]